MKKFNINKKRFKYGTFAAVITIVFIAAVVLVNIIAGMVSDRFSGDIDLTKDKVFEITDQTKDFLKTLDDDIEITVLGDEATIKSSGIEGQHISQVLSKYEQSSDKITVKYINPDKSPEVLTQFNKIYKGDLSSSVAVVRCGDKIKPLSESELLSYTQTSDTQYDVSSTTEQAVTSAIMYVTDDNPMRATILTTESVSDISALTTLLGNNGYGVDETNALTGEINPETTLLILNTPQSDLPESAVDRIAKFLYNDGKLGRSLLYISSYLQKDTPNIDALIAEYGLEAGSGRIFDSDYNNIVQTSDGAYGMFLTITPDEYSKEVQNTSNPVYAPVPGPVNVLFASKDSRETKVLLKTADTSILIPEGADEKLDISSLPQSSQNVLAVGTKFDYDNDKKLTSNVMVLASADFFNTAWMSQANLNNSDYIISAVNAMTGKEAGITITSKSLTSTTLQVKASHAAAIAWMAVIIVPAVILICGIVIWVRRKHR